MTAGREERREEKAREVFRFSVLIVFDQHFLPFCYLLLRWLSCRVHFVCLAACLPESPF